MNEIISQAQYNRYGYGHFKKKWTHLCEQSILLVKKVKFECPIKLEIKWHEKNKRRDPDNVQSGVKFILDALVNQQVLPNDTYEYVKLIAHEVSIDKVSPRIEVNLEALG